MSKNVASFKLLGLDSSASPAEIKERYYGLARVAHPDHGGDVAAFQEINRAYKIALEYAQRPKRCATCGGSGVVHVGSGFSTIKKRCADCKGKGSL